MADIFISFIHEEAGYATAVKIFLAGLLDHPVKPFMSSDKFQVFAGEKWLDRIMDELAGAKIVLLMLSEKSVQRPWVNFEAGAAWTRNIVIVPVCYGGLKKEELPKPYSSLQAVDLTISGEDEYLARSVAHHLGIEEPISYLGTALSALGGEEYQRKCKIIERVYKDFRERLIRLPDNPSKDVWV
jgi:hypothetical protein